MGRHVVAAVSEIPPGERKLVEYEGRSIGVFNVKGKFYALRNRCAHQGGPLCQGRLTGFLQARVPGEYAYSRQGEMLRCPWHGWEFDIKTGQSWWNSATMRTRSYEIDVVPGKEITGPKQGPYEVETYPVAVEEDYVVLVLP